jgi:uncharacterized membrane protein
VTVLLVEGAIRILLLLLDVLKGCLVRVIKQYFFENQIFEIFFAEGIFFEIKIEGTDWCGGWLIIWEM